jgi:hypothetical protein
MFGFFADELPLFDALCDAGCFPAGLAVVAMVRSIRSDV